MSRTYLNADGASPKGPSALDGVLPESANGLAGLRLLGGLGGGLFLVTELETRNPRNWVEVGLNSATPPGVEPGMVGTDPGTARNYTLADGTTVAVGKPAGSPFNPAEGVELDPDVPGSVCIEGRYKRVSDSDSDGGQFYVSGFDLSDIPSGAVIHWVRVAEIRGKAEAAGYWRCRFQDTANESPSEQGPEFTLVAVVGSLGLNTLGPFGTDNGWDYADLAGLYVRAAFDASAGDFVSEHECRLCRCQIEVCWEAA